MRISRSTMLLGVSCVLMLMVGCMTAEGGGFKVTAKGASAEGQAPNYLEIPVGDGTSDTKIKAMYQGTGADAANIDDQGIYEVSGAPKAHLYFDPVKRKMFTSSHKNISASAITLFDEKGVKAFELTGLGVEATSVLEQLRLTHESVERMLIGLAEQQGIARAALFKELGMTARQYADVFAPSFNKVFGKDPPAYDMLPSQVATPNPDAPPAPGN